MEWYHYHVFKHSMTMTSSMLVLSTETFIGLSTNKIGLGTEGEFVGVGTTSGLLMFTSVPGDDYHSFVTDKDNVLTGDVKVTTVNVATSVHMVWKLVIMST